MALGIAERRFSPDHREIGRSLNNLAGVYFELGHYAKAEPLYQRGLEIAERAVGPAHPDVGVSLNNLGELYRAEGRYAEAEVLYKRAFSIANNSLGSDHPQVAALLANIAALYLEQQSWASATDYWRQSTELTIKGLTRGDDKVLTLAHHAKTKGERKSHRFWGLVKAAHRLRMENPEKYSDLTHETFLIAQWAHGSEIAASLAQMAVRSANGSPQLAGLVRDRQDLVTEWQLKDKQLIVAKSDPPGRRKADIEKAMADRLTDIEIRLAEIDQRFAHDFPDYAALASPKPVSVGEVQEQLGADEALVLFLDTPEWKPLPEESFIWVVTKSDVRWVRSNFGKVALTREVAALRCGLDATAWDGEGAAKCAKSLDISPDRAPGPNQSLPFDHARAHGLYTALFNEVQDLIKGKHLMIVPTGPLTLLPFQVLVTKRPASAKHSSISWLAREHAITILPAVSSLKALRRVGKPSAAPRSMIGFGNPLLDGPDGSYSSRAKLGREKQECPETRLQRLAAMSGSRRGALPVERREGLVDLSSVKGQVPLPETADELCAVAKDVKAEVRDIHLGAQATEREVKWLNASGELAKYRLVHFATHGVLAGQLDGVNEPGLILTPPDKATEDDDGYLSASEIAALKLDADWVILSACNTAAGSSTSAEALSGLARAFIYAGARALLVSHWEVYSDATVKLITFALREIARAPNVGRAEAMRRSMVALIDTGEPNETHPAFWAPFVVVGEGGAGR
jgi:CHAT domain-containing protein/tetratricopeptide (TPR) repeat protein